MIGLFLGDTDFSEAVLKNIKKLNKKYFIIDFSKHNKFKRDIIPYGIAHGNRSVLQGLNLIGLRRKNISNKEIWTLNDAYKEIFKNENLTENLGNLNKDYKKNELVLEVVNFLEKDKKRPICTPFSK